MYPDYLLSLRLTLNSLIERTWIIRRLAEEIDPLILCCTIPLEPVTNIFDVEDEVPDAPDVPDGPIPLFSEIVLRSVMNSTYTSNTLNAIKSLRKMEGVPPTLISIDSKKRPSTDGWAFPELQAFVKARETLILTANQCLRDAHTRLAHYMPRYRAILPRVARERAMAGGDLFQRVNITFDPNRETEFFERGFLSAWLDIQTADHIMGRLERMTQVAAPLPGEPPTMTYFGSHVSNRLSIHQICLVTDAGQV